MIKIKMLSKLISKFKWMINPPKLSKTVEKEYLESAHHIAAHVKQSINKDENSDKIVISLGENCNSAWYIKAVGLKKASYPFDWIYSSPEIVLHCLQDDFKTYLEKSYIFNTRSGNSAGHKFYHSSLFNHKNPLKTEDDFQYYKRCVERFKKVFDSTSEIIFVITVITETEKRSGAGWAKGFDRNFKLPVNLNVDSLMEFMNTIKIRHSNAKFLFIEQITEQNPSIEIINKKQDNYVWIKHTSFQRNTGVFYKHKTDDAVAKILYSVLK